VSCTDPSGLLAEPRHALAIERPSPLCVPIVATIRELLEMGTLPSPDLPSAARQALLAYYGERAHDLVFEVAANLSTAPRDWAVSFEATTTTEGLAVKPKQWRPRWLSTDEADPAAALWKSEVRRSSDEITADPFFTELLGYTTYNDVAQRRAIYSILVAPAGSTHLVTLPTGSGKTSVALAPSLLWARRRGGTAIFVVPTVTLAVDLESRARPLVEKLFPESADVHLAYLGDRDPVSRARIRERLRDGSQSIVFATPEALLGTLKGSLYAAARSGLLVSLVIDEAHIVGEWGTEFRPEFQSLAGLRRGLLRAVREAHFQDFTTILLTATLTQEHLRTLTAHFSEGSGATRTSPTLTASVVLRPEPSYWFANCASEGDRHLRVLELAAYLPRPIVFYTTKRSSARELHALLYQAGYRRLGIVTGETDSEARSAVLRGLGPNPSDSRIDIVVATSAFGLGIDNPHIRSIVHACVPESIDRLYQEVGRAGRDGLASLSIVLATEEDHAIARQIGRKKIITVERARERWLGMMASAEHVGGSDDLVRVDLPARPADLVWDSDLNEDWNVRVLNLMARAGYVELEDEPRVPIEIGAEGAPFVTPAKQLLRVLRNDLSDHTSWEAFDQVRAAARASELRSLASVDAATRSDRDIAEVLAEAYRIRPEGGLPYNVAPQLSCGGCGFCRANRIHPYEGPTPLPELGSQSALPPEILAFFRQMGSTIVATYRPPVGIRSRAEWTRDCWDLTRVLVGRGLRLLIFPESLRAMETFRSLHRSALGGFALFGTMDDLTLLDRLPSVVILDKEMVSKAPLSQLLSRDGTTPRVVVLPENTADPEYRTSTLEASRAPVFAIRALIEKI